ncbi:dihydrolipoyl dehydrogenase family protein [Enterococcus sp. AZ072]|uniref:dihydrolipoyl dehydrogenase family protein n=1 Tax=unclassified Enterococcus TaxID=2608891 RepID=UPI003D2DF1F4
MEKEYDVVFIGSGHAAWHAAMTLRGANKTVAIIEKEKIAGTCTNFGCNPKILLDSPFELIERLELYKGIGINEVPQVQWKDLMNYKHGVINPLTELMEQTFKKAQIDIYKGSGKFIDAHAVQVNDEVIKGETIVIATGQRSNRLPIPGKDYLHTSQDFLDLTEMPKRIVFIGAGLISLEFVSMAAKMGSEIHVVEFSDKALPAYYDKYAEKIVEGLKQEQVQFHFNTEVVEVTKDETEYSVKTKNGQIIKTDYVLDATGRIPNVEDLGLEDIGVTFNKKGIEVDDYLRTSVPNICASGDVIDKAIPRLTPTATFESNYLAAQFLGHTEKIAYPVIPSVVYTLPRIAQVGVSQKEAQESDRYHTATLTYGKMFVFETKNETEAEATIVLDEENYLVGADVYSNDAADLINLFTLVINQRMTASQLNQMIFAFPTVSIALIQLMMPMLHQ